MDVARALVASGTGRDSRVGILMTNRPEFLSSLFGIALAGAVPVALSTFSTPQELDHIIRASQVSLLLFEQQVLKKDFFAQLLELEPAIVDALPGKLVSQHYPFLRHLVALGGASGAAEPLPTRSEGAIETWDSFLAHGRHIAEDVVLERADSVHPADLGGIFFSSGTTSLPKGIEIGRAHV